VSQIKGKKIEVQAAYKANIWF